MSSAGRCIACSTSSGMLVGPGIARNSRPARTTIVVVSLKPCALEKGCRGMTTNSSYNMLNLASLPADGSRECARLFAQRTGYTVPDLILDLSGGGARNDAGGTGSLVAARDEAQDPDFAIGVIEIAAAVASVHGRTDPRHLISSLHHSGVLELGGEQLSFGIDVGADVVGDGAGIAADTDASIVFYGAEPDRPLFLALVQDLPEAYMMAVIGAVAVRFLECEILAPVEIEQRADRRVAIGAIQQHAAGNLDG